MEAIYDVVAVNESHVSLQSSGCALCEGQKSTFMIIKKIKMKRVWCKGGASCLLFDHAVKSEVGTHTL